MKNRNKRTRLRNKAIYQMCTHPTDPIGCAMRCWKRLTENGFVELSYEEAQMIFGF